MQDSLKIFSNAAGDRAQFLEQYLPDTEKTELWVVSDSVLSFTNYKKQPKRLFKAIWEERREIWHPYISEAKFGVVDCGNLDDLVNEF